MDTLEWMLWPARWAILVAGLLAQMAALAMRQAPARTGSIPSPPSVRLPAPPPPPGSGLAHGSTPAMAADIGPTAGAHATKSSEYPGKTPPPAASLFRISRALLLTGGGLVAVFALLERDILLLAGQVLAVPLLWPRLR